MRLVKGLGIEVEVVGVGIGGIKGIERVRD